MKERTFPENLPPSWRQHLSAEVGKTYFKELSLFLVSEYQKKQTIYPTRENILRALQSVDLEGVKVVILGQDPYHGKDQAIGLSFGVPNSLFPKPPSLLNIFKELKTDLGIDAKDSDLTGWASQGVLLLNTVLTVRQGQAFSHKDHGWEQFTDRVIFILNERETPVIFVLWGSAAQQKKRLLNQERHIILESSHPSPLSSYRGFFGSRPFSKVNQILVERLKKEPIHWEQISGSRSAK